MKYKKIWIALSMVTLILVWSNPSDTDFAKFYRMEKGEELKNVEEGLPYGRTGYFGLFSIYKFTEASVYFNGSYGKKRVSYLGVFNNFIRLSEVKE